MSKTSKLPSDMLAALGAIYRDRNKMYGNNYKAFGHSCMSIFPKGIELKTVDDFNRFGVFVMIVSKVSRYAAMFTNGGHPDSLDDLAIYSQMLQELDSEILNQRKGNRK